MEDLVKGQVEVIATDLPKDLIKRMSEYTTWQDEAGFKRLQENAGIAQKDTLSRLRHSIQKLVEARRRCVWLYSYKEDYGLLCSLPISNSS